LASFTAEVDRRRSVRSGLEQASVSFPSGRLVFRNESLTTPLLAASRRPRRTRLQGFELRENPCIHPPGFTPTVGADPLLGFQLPRVFPPPAMTGPIAQSPLTHLDPVSAETTTAPVPQSLNEQEDWLFSLENADPCELFVLVSVSPDGLNPGRVPAGNNLGFGLAEAPVWRSVGHVQVKSRIQLIVPGIVQLTILTDDKRDRLRTIKIPLSRPCLCNCLL
jgi:hypothetical protein